jgi:hypothetical protein
MMRRILFSVCGFAFAVTAIVMCNNNLAPAQPSDFRQFAYVPLVRAEYKFNKGNHIDALKEFKIAYTRASRCGRKGLANRIISRIANAGIELDGIDHKQAWPYFSYYALVSDDFSRSSGDVENWCLSKNSTSSPFRYEIVQEGSSSTVWGSTFNREPLFITALFNKVFPKNEENKESTPASILNGLCKTWGAPVRIICPRGVCATTIHIKGLKSGQKVFIRTNNELLDTNNFVRQSDGSMILKLADRQSYLSFYEVLVQSSYGSGLNLQVEMVKEYEKF